MKRICLILVLALLTGCAPAPSGCSFTDDLGRSVTVESSNRVVCLLGSFAQIWTLAGGEVAAAAEDAWEDYGLELPGAASLGTIKQPSLEAIFEAEPDLVLASAAIPGQVQLQETLEAAQIPTVYFDVKNFEDYLRMLKFCTDLTGRPDLYEANGLAVQAQIDATVAAARQREPRKILYLRVTSSGVRAKGPEGSVLGEMLQDLGCINIAQNGKPEQLSIEYILQEDPDFIFLTPMGDTQRARATMDQFFAENPLWADLRAVQSGRVHLLPKELYHLKPNARWGEAYTELEAMLREG